MFILKTFRIVGFVTVYYDVIQGFESVQRLVD